MENKLYVGGLSFQTTDEGLKDFFAQAGTVFAQAGTVNSAKVIIDKMTGKSRGFGFVEMSSGEEADKAVEMCNGKELDGRTLKVDKARPMQEGRPRGSFRSNRY